MIFDFISIQLYQVHGRIAKKHKKTMYTNSKQKHECR